MILAFSLSDIIRVPFGYLMDWLYLLTNSYGLALILFAILVKVLLTPVQAKAKKSSMKMSRMQPMIQKIQARYADDQQKQGEAMNQLYKEEGISPFGGCLWGFVPLLILLPLYQVVRQPIVYMLHETAANADTITEIIKNGLPEYFTKNNYYDQMIAVQHISNFESEIRAAIPEIKDTVLAGLNFTFLGIDLGAVPTYNVFAWEVWDWAHIGAFLVPVLSAGSQVLSMFISQKMNDSLITDEKGVQDEETAKNSQANQTMKTAMWMMPIMSLVIGFTIPGALSLYWFVQGIFSVVQDVILTKKYRTIYDAEDAVRLQKAMEEDRIEAEKERVRAERRAMNPDGITQNTSKKKMTRQQQQAEDAAKAAARREYAAKKGAAEEADESESCISGIPSRPYCKGRNYDPDRYRTETEE